MRTQKIRNHLKLFTLLICFMFVLVSGANAYMTDAETAANVVTVGNVDIALQEDVWESFPDDDADQIPDIAEQITPNQIIKKDPSVSNTGDNDAWVYVSVEIPVCNIIAYEDNGVPINNGTPADTELFSFTPDDNWILISKTEETGKVVYVYGYKEVLSPKTETSKLFNEVRFVNAKDGQGLENSIQHVIVNAYAIQSEYSGDVLEAWDRYCNQNELKNNAVTNLLIPGPDFNATIPAAATKVAFVDDTAPAAYTFDNGKLLDVSDAQDEGVVSWYDEANTTYYVSTQRPGLDALINPNSSYMFSRKSNLKEFDFTSLDTKLSTDMSYMFYQSTGLTSIDISSFNTDEVKSMKYMFGTNGNSNPMKLTEIALGQNFNSSKVEDTSYMFRNCQNLLDLDYDQIDTSSSKSFFAMFYRCYKLDNIDLSSWNTSSCEDMAYMFAFNSQLTSLDLSNFKTEKVKNMESMFSGCNSLSGLSVAHFDTSSCEDLGFMFYGCKGLKTIDFANWDVRKVQSFDHLLAHSNMEDYDVSGWEVTSACTNLNAIFHSTRETYIDVTGWDTSNVIAFNQLCDGMYYLERIDGLETWNTSKGVCFAEMFNSCGSLKEINLSSFDTRNCNEGTIISGNGDTSYGFWCMFSSCGSLEKLTLGENFTRFGNGTVKSGNYAYFPTPASGYWYNAETGQAYLPEEIPDLTAATYVSTQP